MAKKIIIVDDDEDLLRLLSQTFKGKGFEIQSFKTGKEALGYLLEDANIQSAHLLILDRLLPDMDGIEILKQFKQKHPQFPVLILSVLSAEKDVVQGLQFGAVDYVAKPFSLPVLIQKALSLIR